MPPSIHQRESLDAEHWKEICENLSSRGVTSVRRIKVRRNNELLPTNTFILTFDVPSVPPSIKAGYLNIPLEPFIPNPLRCFKCQRFGHGQNTCRGKRFCARCGLPDHDSKTCTKDTICANCKGNHCILASFHGGNLKKRFSRLGYIIGSPFQKPES